MKNFKQYYDLYLEFFDEIDGAVKHIDHLEENVLNKGKAGVIEALENIDAAIEYFVGETDYKISTKFDGAPAIVAGAVTLGVMQQIIRAFGRVEGSMQYILKAWPTIIELASVYKRLREFESKINQDELIDEKI